MLGSHARAARPAPPRSRPVRRSPAPGAHADVAGSADDHTGRAARGPRAPALAAGSARVAAASRPPWSRAASHRGRSRPDARGGSSGGRRHRGRCAVGGAGTEEPDPVEAPQAPVAAAEVAEPAPAPEPVGERSGDRKVLRTPLPVSPEDAAVEAPWARAARMVEPRRELSASDELQPVADAAPDDAPRRPGLALVPSVDGDLRLRSSWRPRTESVQRPSKPELAESVTAQRSRSRKPARSG